MPSHFWGQPQVKMHSCAGYKNIFLIWTIAALESKTNFNKTKYAFYKQRNKQRNKQTNKQINR